MLPADFPDWFKANLSTVVKPSMTIDELCALATVDTPYSLAVRTELEAMRKFLLHHLKGVKREEQIRLEQEREIRILDGALQLLQSENRPITGTELLAAREQFLSAKLSQRRVRAPSKIDFELVQPLLGKQEITLCDLEGVGVHVAEDTHKSLRDYLSHHGYKASQLPDGTRFFRKKGEEAKSPARPRQSTAKQNKGGKGGFNPPVPDKDVISMRQNFLDGMQPGKVAKKFGRDPHAVRLILTNASRSDVLWPGGLGVLEKGPLDLNWIVQRHKQIQTP